MTSEKLFLAMLCALTCATAVRTSEHMYWSTVPHPPLLQLVDWMDSEPAGFTNDCVYYWTLGPFETHSFLRRMD